MLQRIAALCLALMLLVCTCAAAETVDDSRLLAVVNGVRLSVDEVEREFQDYAAYYREDGRSDEDVEQLKEMLAREAVLNEVLRQKAEELGLAEFTDEEIASFLADAQNQYDNMLSYYMDFFAGDGLSESEVREQTVAYFDESGYTVESVLRRQLEDAAQERLYEQVTSTVEMTEQEAEVYYAQRVEADRQNYSENLYAFEYALCGESVVTYVPAGFRTVRALLICFDDEVMMSMFDLMQQREELLADEEGNADRLARLEEQIAQLEEPTRQKMNEVQARLDAGEDFSDLLKEYGEDKGAEMEPFASQGCYVSADSVVWPAEFIQTAMSLTEPGEISQPFSVYYGMYMLRYEGEVAEGPVPFESIHDALMREAMEGKTQQAYQDQIDQWYDQAQIEMHLENLQEAQG